MVKIILDGMKIKTNDDLFECLKIQIDNEEFYGNNLDALEEVLTSLNKEVIVNIDNEVLLKENLGNRYKILLEIFEDLNIKVEINN